MTTVDDQPGMSAKERREARARKSRAEFRERVDRAQDVGNRVVDSIQDFSNVIIDGAQDAVEDVLEVKDALERQLKELLSLLHPGQLLALVMEAAKMAGDQSFLDRWRIHILGS